MAERIVREITDDLDGTPAVETIEFSMDGKSFSIDLSKKNADKMRKAFAPYIEAGRKHASVSPIRRNRGGATDTAKVKAWADKTGREYPTRGRLPQALIEEYATAQKAAR